MTVYVEFPHQDQLFAASTSGEGLGLMVWHARSPESSGASGVWIEQSGATLRIALSEKGKLQAQVHVHLPMHAHEDQEMLQGITAATQSYGILNRAMSVDFSGPWYDAVELSDEREEVLDRLERFLMIAGVTSNKTKPVLQFNEMDLKEISNYAAEEKTCAQDLVLIIRFQRELFGKDDQSIHDFMGWLPKNSDGLLKGDSEQQALSVVFGLPSVE